MTEPAAQLGKYTLTRHLATGGMAEIWLAEQAGPGGFNKELVIKRILPHFAEDKLFTTMFLDEARLAAQLSHPKIAQIYELGEIDDHYFIAMEYIQGIDLDVMLETVVSTGELIPVEVVCKVVMDVLEALDYAHDFTDRTGEPFNLVHRDVSPHNVLVSNDGIVKLCDFGVAKAKANQTKTQPGAVKGKFAYMAPEQIQNADDLDRRADVFAVGVMFYELLTGDKPFGDELAAVNNIIASPHPDVRDAREDVPDAIAIIIDRALQKDRKARYPDAHTMMRDIETFVRGLDEYVGDRELSRYVRTVQGLPVTRHSQPVVTVDSELEPLDALADTGPQAAPPQPSDPRITNREPAVVGGTAKIPAPTEPGVRTDTQATDINGDPPSHTKLYILAFAAILAIAGMVGYIAIVVLPPPVVSQTPQVKPPVVQPIEARQANASLLRKPGGLPVLLRSRPTADLYVNDVLVGSTPFQALLPVGKYKVEFRTKAGKSKVETITIAKETKNVLIQL